ncbi:hypothetical protein [Jiulongibacter sediminis]|uniref:hypothetical protein n=1 Tax=Jiulongibacter sediminis TaxID=1605367 RepID=UPI0026EF0895|nr:hypothetical protein [Jiulongibacter sediminis]
MRKKLIAQISKDMEMSGFDFEFSELKRDSYQDLFKHMESLITPLFEKSSPKLFSLLYRIDVSEKEIALAGLELPDYTHPQILSHVILKRELKKVLIREYYRS